MKWFAHFVCMGIYCAGFLGQAIAQNGSVTVPPHSGSVSPSTIDARPGSGPPSPSTGREGAVPAPSSFDIPEISPTALPPPAGVPGVAAKGNSSSAAQPSLSSLLGSSNSSNAENAATEAANMVFLKFGYAQGSPVYLIDERSREGLVFFSVPVQEFQRITKMVLPELEPGLLTQVPIRSELHFALKQSFAGSLFQIELPTGLENSSDGGVRVVTTLESK